MTIKINKKYNIEYKEEFLINPLSLVRAVNGYHLTQKSKKVTILDIEKLLQNSKIKKDIKKIIYNIVHTEYKFSDMNSCRNECIFGISEYLADEIIKKDDKYQSISLVYH